jgi:ATP-dependent DNA helicase RecQ
MQEIGVVSQSPTGVRLKTKFDVGSLLSGFEQRHREYQSSRVEMMRGYAERSVCCRGYILNYFGEPFDGKGCLCDNHSNGTLTRDVP